MSLRDDMAERSRRIAAEMPQLSAAYDTLVASLRDRRIGAASLKAGKRMPFFALPNLTGRMISARELQRQGPLVVSFFRGGWCPYCTAELRALQKALPEITGLGARLVAITPDTGTAFAEIGRRHSPGFEVLSDVDQGVGLAFGILFRVPDEILALYRGIGLDLAARHGSLGGSSLLPLPATYVIDRKGIIRHAEIEPDFRRRLDPEEILSILRQIVG